VALPPIIDIIGSNRLAELAALEPNGGDGRAARERRSFKVIRAGRTGSCTRVQPAWRSPEPAPPDTGPVALAESATSSA
jgi:hypothetical protein